MVFWFTFLLFFPKKLKNVFMSLYYLAQMYKDVICGNNTINRTEARQNCIGAVLYAFKYKLVIAQKRLF